MAQDIRRIGIHQHGKAGAQAISFGIDQHGAFAPNAAAQHTSQAKQGPAAANLAGLAATVADDFAIGTQNSFQERNGAQNRLPSVTVGQKTLVVQG